MWIERKEITKHEKHFHNFGRKFATNPDTNLHNPLNSLRNKGRRGLARCRNPLCPSLDLHKKLRT